MASFMNKMTFPLSFDQQSIRMEGIANARELGGYVMADGRRIRHGLLLRSGNLLPGTDADIERLANVYHVVHVCDFRSEAEVRHAPDKDVRGSDNLHLPSIDPTNDDWAGTELAEVARNFTPERMVKAALTYEAKYLTLNMYPSLVTNEYTQLQYATFLNYVANTTDGAVLWHCSQGKDRTGWGAAFVLAALGASRELIVEDFDMSNIFYQELLDDLIGRLVAAGGQEEDIDVLRAFIGCSRKNFIATLDIIDRVYGSMHKYLNNQLCLTDEEMAKMQAHYLE